MEYMALIKKSRKYFENLNQIEQLLALFVLCISIFFSLFHSLYLLFDSLEVDFYMIFFYYYFLCKKKQATAI